VEEKTIQLIFGFINETYMQLNLILFHLVHPV